jgi:hypothetical protein
MACSEAGFSLEPRALSSIVGTMSQREKTNELSWPWWAPWALLAVAITSLLTIAATLYDIR